MPNLALNSLVIISIAGTYHKCNNKPNVLAYVTLYLHCIIWP